MGNCQLWERINISFHFAARTGLYAALKATRCIALGRPMEFRASDTDKTWHFSRTEPATRAADLKWLRGSVRRMCLCHEP